jgi:hypothetical protein
LGDVEKTSGSDLTLIWIKDTHLNSGRHVLDVGQPYFEEAILKVNGRIGKTAWTHATRTISNW